MLGIVIINYVETVIGYDIVENEDFLKFSTIINLPNSDVRILYFLLNIPIFKGFDLSISI